GERGADEILPGMGVFRGASMRRPGDKQHDELVEVQLPQGGLGQHEMAVVRRIEGAAKDADQSSSRSSPSTSTSSPVLAPAARSAASSSPPSGARPVTRKPRSVRRILNGRAPAAGR